jgi:hypothetical protein
MQFSNDFFNASFNMSFMKKHPIFLQKGAKLQLGLTFFLFYASSFLHILLFCCRNISLGLVTKARAYKGAGQ